MTFAFIVVMAVHIGLAPPEACCIGGTCSKLDQLECIQAGGIPLGPDTICGPGACGPVECNPESGPCQEPNGTPGCEDFECCAVVCGVDPFCCEVEWDSLCVDEARDFCAPRACCLPTGCADTSLLVCGAFLNGLPQGEGSTCGTTTCEIDTACSACGPGQHWIDTPLCAGDVDNIPAGATVDIDMDLDCLADLRVTLNGPAAINRTSALDDSLNYPALRPIDEHFDVMDTEILAMRLAGNGFELRAGKYQGTDGTLSESHGAIAEDLGEPSLSQSILDVFLEIRSPEGQSYFNRAPLRLAAIIDCVPPDTTYVQVQECLPLFDLPPEDPGKPVHVANLVGTACSTYPGCGDPGTGECFTGRNTPFCSSGSCCEAICEVMPSCCTMAWDDDCAALAINDCDRACCRPNGSCEDISPELCDATGGSSGQPGSNCETTDCPGACENPQAGECCDAGNNSPGCSDGKCCESVCAVDGFCCEVSWDTICAAEAEEFCGCPACPDGQVTWLTPTDNFVDARQPTPLNSATTLLGVDRIVVGAPIGAGDDDCWHLCETNQNPNLHPLVPPNAITGVVNNIDGTYTIQLAHALIPGEVTRIAYVSVSGMTVDSCRFVAQPGDVNGDGVTALADVLSLIDSLNDAVPLTLPRTDTDRSGEATGADILRVIDLLNGAGKFESWLEARVSEDTPCPQVGAP